MARAKKVGAVWRDVLGRIGREHVLDEAASASFWLFVALLPLAAVSLMVATKLAWGNESVLTSLMTWVPPRSRDLITHELAHVAAWNGGTVAPVSVAVFVWLAASGVHAVLDAFDATLDAQRAWWKKRLLAIAICVGLSVAVALVAIAFAALGHGLVHVVTQTPARYVVAIVGEFVFIVGLFWAGVPKNARCKAPRWPGAILAAVLQSLLGWGYVLYLHTLGKGTAYSSATLQTIGATMIMVYLFTLSLLVGVVFNAVLSKPREERGRAPAVTPGRFAHEAS